MASTLLEQTRQLHEDIERLERVVVKDFKGEARTHKEKLTQAHRVRKMLDAIQQRTEQLVGCGGVGSRCSGRCGGPARCPRGGATGEASSGAGRMLLGHPRGLPLQHARAGWDPRFAATRQGCPPPLPLARPAPQTTIYEDEDGARKEEIAALRGDDVYG